MKRSRSKRRPPRQERRTILLVTNGQVTEKTYLDDLKQRVDRKRFSLTTRFIPGEPQTVLEELDRSDISAFAEVWIIIDHDGVDRSSIITRCRQLCTKRTTVTPVISVPCFEVWLNAHYAPVRHYTDQKDAQRHYLTLTGLSAQDAKKLAGSFPWENAAIAAQQCHLPDAELPQKGSQGSSPSTTMPHLLHSLGLLETKDLH
ncbi:RloB family protein [Actinomyces faecalis]|uniref:RloB family protein n=1 Tax=Actinomyces faecalis TaxID=2722820 RepID=UPI0015534D25|nr:RloB family protein [Actinomyces faecalis]